jgi:hypothetical protein
LAKVIGVASSSVDLPGRVLIGVLTSVFPPTLVDEVVEEAGARELRQRSLPARLMVYFCLACWLYMSVGYDGVLRTLVDGLRDTGAGWGSWTVPSTGSISKARARLGSRTLELLFRRVAGPVGTAGTEGVFWRGLRLVAMDGTLLDVPDTADNRQEFGVSANAVGGGAYPQMRLVALAECGTRAVLDAVFGGYRTSEQELARDLLPAMRPGMLVLADRNFPSWGLWREAAGTGADLLWRVRAGFTLPVRKVLADGTYLSELKPRRRKDGKPITVRVIEYSIATDDDTSELFCLLTTLLDPQAAPALELAELYAQRWEMENAFKELKVTQRGPGVVLRSQDPAGVRQEIWAMLCVYQALRQLITRAADQAGIDPDRISFKNALNAARRSTGTAISPPADQADY